MPAWRAATAAAAGTAATARSAEGPAGGLPAAATAAATATAATARSAEGLAGGLPAGLAGGRAGSGVRGGATLLRGTAAGAARAGAWAAVRPRRIVALVSSLSKATDRR